MNMIIKTTELSEAKLSAEIFELIVKCSKEGMHFCLETLVDTLKSNGIEADKGEIIGALTILVIKNPETNVGRITFLPSLSDDEQEVIFMMYAIDFQPEPQR